MMENPIKMDDLGVPLFSETSIYLGVLPYPKTHWPPGCNLLVSLADPEAKPSQKPQLVALLEHFNMYQRNTDKIMI